MINIATVNFSQSGKLWLMLQQTQRTNKQEDKATLICDSVKQNTEGKTEIGAWRQKEYSYVRGIAAFNILGVVWGKRGTNLAWWL